MRGYWIFLLAVLWSEALAQPNLDVEKAFKAYEIDPDVIPKAPTDFAEVYYPSGVDAKLGNELTPTQVKDMPIVTWNRKKESYYTLAMVDPDVPSRVIPTNRELLHWLIGNIPGALPVIGEVLAEYIGAGPPPATGFHRYAFLVYEQPGPLIFDEPRLNNTSLQGREKFSIVKFAGKYKLKGPVAGNFFQAQYDNYVPILFAQLGDYSLLPLYVLNFIPKILKL